MHAVTGGMNQFVMEDKARIGPPLRREKCGMKVNDANLVWPQPVAVSATDPPRYAVPPDGSSTEDAERNASKLIKVLTKPCVHALHARENLCLERLEEARLLRGWAHADHPSGPSMIGWMSFLDGDKQAFALRTPLSFSLERHVHPSFSPLNLGHARRHAQVRVHRCGPEQADGVRSGNGAWDVIVTCSVHEPNGSGPVPVAIEQSPDNAPVNHPRKGVVVRLGSEHGHQFFALSVRVNLQTVGVGWAAPVADGTGSIGALNTL